MEEFTTSVTCDNSIRRVFQGVFSDISKVKPDFTDEEFTSDNSFGLNISENVKKYLSYQQQNK